VFFAPKAGMGALLTALVDDLHARGVTVVTDRLVALERSGGGWRVALVAGAPLEADGVVLTIPAPHAAEVLRPHAARAATLLGAISYASVAMVRLAVPRAAVERELDGSGFLVPRAEARTITACSWTSAKWPHLAGDGTVWLRASVGRDGDDAALALPDEAIVDAVVADLADTMALRGRPTEARVTRWTASLPQYRVGHLARMDALDADLAAATPGVVVTGAALRGLGIPACIRQGAGAARTVLAALDAAR
jgi:oxygen-dependent protoporphyrinogen oxidase